MCTPDQLEDEFAQCLDLVKYTLKTLGLYEDVSYRFSQWDPEDTGKYIGTKEQWDEAQGVMKTILDDLGIDYKVGIGESETITICFDANCRVSGMRINAGYQKSADLYSKNSRPSVLRVIYTDGSTEDCALQDINGMQEIHFSREMVTGSISLMIVSVYPGTKYSDTVISEIQFF